MDKTVLKPCPFCGCHGLGMTSDSANPKRHTIKCQDCPGRMEFFSSDRQQAIAAWNGRYSAAPAQTLDVITRYGWTEGLIGQPSELVEDAGGMYVKFEDVQVRLSRQNNKGTE